MSKVVKMTRDDDRLEKAVRWILRLEEGLSGTDKKELQVWLGEHPDNVTEFLAVAKVWDKTEELSRLADLFPHEQAVAKSWPKPMMAAAAAAALVVVALVLTLGDGIGTQELVAPGSQLVADSITRYETAVGEQSTVTLQDGTIVVLNTNSRLDVDYLEDARVLRLYRGEIHVDVATDIDRPLSVIVGDRIVQAVGTSFGIEISEGQMIDLVVTEGKVVVGILSPIEQQNISAKNWQPQVLTQSVENMVVAGEELILGDTEESIKSVSLEEIEVKLSWRDGSLIFKGKQLADAIAEVERYTTVEFVFLDEELKSRSVTGRFKAGDIEGLLVSLRLHFDIKHEFVSEDRVLLSSL